MGTSTAELYRAACWLQHGPRVTDLCFSWFLGPSDNPADSKQTFLNSLPDSIRKLRCDGYLFGDVDHSNLWQLPNLKHLELNVGDEYSMLDCLASCSALETLKVTLLYFIARASNNLMASEDNLHYK